MTFTVGGLGGPLTGVSLDLEVAHTWVGDLIITLTRPDSTAFSIMDRPGRVGSGFGFSSDFVFGSGDYTFTDSGVVLTSVLGGSSVPFGDYRTAGVDDLPTTFNSFVTGLSPAAAAGTWTLSIRDNASGDSGTFQLARLNLTTAAVVPEPGSAMLNLVLGSAGIALTTRRRRR